MEIIKNKLETMWRYGIGTVFVLKDKKYCFIEKGMDDSYGKVYDYETGLIEYLDGDEYEEDTEVEVWIGEKDLDTAIYGMMMDIIGLVQDGFCIDSEPNQFINLKGDICRLKTIVELKRIVDGGN